MAESKSREFMPIESHQEMLIHARSGKILDVVENSTWMFSDKNVRESCQLVLFELLENAVKYSSPSEPLPISVVVQFHSGNIAIKISNRVHNKQDAFDLLAMWDEIKQNSDKRGLYQKRLEEIFNNPAQARVRLGLYRIFCETDFEILFNYQAPVMEILALYNTAKQDVA